MGKSEKIPNLLVGSNINNKQFILIHHLSKTARTYLSGPKKID
jgi:hypothetical protein